MKCHGGRSRKMYDGAIDPALIPASRVREIPYRGSSTGEAMPATKSTRKRNTARSTDRERPLTPDQYLALDNKPAAKKMPSELAEAAGTRRVEIYSPGKDFDPRKIIRQDNTSGAWELDLPPGAGVGLPGRNSAKLPMRGSSSFLGLNTYRRRLMV